MHSQPERFSGALRLLSTAVKGRAFPGAAAAVVHGGETILLAGVGRFTYEQNATAVSGSTVYDLASVSKALATTTMVAMLFERGRLSLDSPLIEFFPEFAAGDPTRARVTLRMLLAHTSGLPEYVRLFETAANRDELAAMALRVPLTHEPGSHTEYSDIGFIILGEVLAQVAGERLDKFCQREIFRPLGMADTTFRPPATWKLQIPPTEDDRKFRKRIVRGEVHDENAWVMEGVSGHAGVFASAYDVAQFAACMLRQGAPILRPETVKLFTQRDDTFADGTRALGWDRPTPPSQSGCYFSPQSFGHLGFTGTSLWIDPERDVAIVLLSNRTWPDRSDQAIKEVRPAFHDLVMQVIANQQKQG